MSKKVASLEKISKTYGKDDLTVKALDSINLEIYKGDYLACLLYTSPSPRDTERSRMPSSA